MTSEKRTPPLFFFFFHSSVTEVQIYTSISTTSRSTVMSREVW